MSIRKILVILGHPRQDSFCNALAESYASGAAQSGHEVRHVNLKDLQFDPLFEGYGQPKALEPDMRAAQEAIAWADHLVFVYPNWWGGMPTLMRGFIDRVFLPGFAFKYRDKGLGWDRLLAGKSAQLLVTMDTPPWYYWLVNRAPGHRMMRDTILGFCGVKPVHIKSFGSIKTSKEEVRLSWLHQAERMGASQ